MTSLKWWISASIEVASSSRGAARPCGRRRSTAPRAARRGLLDDPHRLAHLLHPHPVAVVAVADGAHRDLEVDLAVGEVGVALRRSHGSPAARSSGPVTPSSSRRSRGTMPTPLVRRRKISLRFEDRLVLVDPGRHLGAEGAQLLRRSRPGCPRRRRRPGSSGCASAARSTSRTCRGSGRARGSVQEHRHRAEVERRRPEPEQVRVDAVELQVDRPQVLRARRDLELEQPLDRSRTNASMLKK